MVHVDEALPDGECWFRPLTNTTHITNKGPIHGSSLRFSDADQGGVGDNLRFRG